jgi:GntR family transcriptional regulator / MocR family aminotransferase
VSSRAASFALAPRRKHTPIVRWLYEEFRSAILDGRLVPGSRLPSRNELARSYRVSSRTVAKAFDRLMRHGFVDSRVGLGTYVVGAPADGALTDGVPSVPMPPTASRRVLSSRGRVLASQPSPKSYARRNRRTFALDCPALDLFPIDIWNRLCANRLTRGALELLDHGEPLGFPPLRAAIAQYIGQARAVRCTAEQVVVTSGTVQSLDLIARLLIDAGDSVWMEDPGCAGVASLLRGHGAEVVGVPVDAEGVNCATGRVRGPFARLAYVTPGCQFPTGASMSLERRLQLLQWANRAGAWIFEDDYDGCFGFENRRPSLHSIDRGNCVIYSSNLSSVLFPALRIGFMVLPTVFVEPVAAALSTIQRYRATLDQAVLADFIREGHLESHARRMREIYSARRAVLMETGRRELDGLMQFDESQDSLQVIGWLAPELSDTEVARCAAARNVDSVALSDLSVGRRMSPGLVLGIGSADERAIRAGLNRLGRLLRLLTTRPGAGRGSGISRWFEQTPDQSGALPAELPTRRVEGAIPGGMP